MLPLVSAERTGENALECGHPSLPSAPARLQLFLKSRVCARLSACAFCTHLAADTAPDTACWFGLPSFRTDLRGRKLEYSNFCSSCNLTTDIYTTYSYSFGISFNLFSVQSQCWNHDDTKYPRRIIWCKPETHVSFFLCLQSHRDPLSCLPYSFDSLRFQVF